jgi:hypothetical protein
MTGLAQTRTIRWARRRAPLFLASAVMLLVPVESLDAAAAARLTVSAAPLQAWAVEVDDLPEPPIVSSRMPHVLRRTTPQPKPDPEPSLVTGLSGTSGPWRASDLPKRGTASQGEARARR